jgi:hypothetical protein
MVNISAKIGAFIGLGVLLAVGIFMVFAGSLFSGNYDLVTNGWNIIWLSIILIIIKMAFDFIKDKGK